MASSLHFRFHMLIVCVCVAAEGTDVGRILYYFCAVTSFSLTSCHRAARQNSRGNQNRRNRRGRNRRAAALRSHALLTMFLLCFWGHLLGIGLYSHSKYSNDLLGPNQSVIRGWTGSAAASPLASNAGDRWLANFVNKATYRKSSYGEQMLAAWSAAMELICIDDDFIMILAKIIQFAGRLRRSCRDS